MFSIDYDTKKYYLSYSEIEFNEICCYIVETLVYKFLFYILYDI